MGVGGLGVAGTVTKYRHVIRQAQRRVRDLISWREPDVRTGDLSGQQIVGLYQTRREASAGQ
jgi:hypothetical protein